MSPRAINFFSSEEKQTILDAIREAELNTSGEIRLHIEEKCKGDVLDRAAFLFSELGMDKTAQRNGVLFYLAVKSRRFAIIGDKGINEVVPEDFWESIKEMMAGHFREGEFVEGLSKGILQAGTSLQAHFPYQTDDKNELPDDISFNKP
jgi:uncharacterized membrane protein